jgi:hypothetical protein
MPIPCVTKALSIITITLAINHIVSYVFVVLIINNRHFLPYSRADLAGLGWVGICFVAKDLR